MSEISEGELAGLWGEFRSLKAIIDRDPAGALSTDILRYLELNQRLSRNVETSETPAPESPRRKNTMLLRGVSRIAHGLRAAT